MPRLSKISVETKRMGYFISNLWNTISLIENREQAVTYLKELLTPTEIRMLAKRIMVAKMLLEGYKYQDIIPFVRVTSTTISSVNNQLQFGDGGYIKILEKLIKMEKKKQKDFENSMSGRKSLFYPKPLGGLAEWGIEKIERKLIQKSKLKSVEKEIK